MVRLLALALVTAGSPALAGDGGGYALNRTSAYDRTFLYLGGDESRGPRIYSRDDGFFQGRGAGAFVSGGKAMFDYDRDYPYDFPARWGAEENGSLSMSDEPTRVPTCSDEPVRDRRSGERTTVRICR